MCLFKLLFSLIFLAFLYHTLAIFNILGQKVKEITNGFFPAGTHEVVWNGKNSSGVKVASGICFYILKTEHVGIIKKMILSK